MTKRSPFRYHAGACVARKLALTAKTHDFRPEAHTVASSTAIVATPPPRATKPHPRVPGSFHQR